MTTLREIFTAFGPEYLEHYPQLPLAHRKVISAIQQCQSGHYGHSLYQCHTVGSNTVSIIPVVTVTARSVSTIKPSNGYSTTSINSSPGRTSCSPLPCLSPPTLHPCASTPRVPRHVSRLGNCPQTAGRRRRFVGTALPGFTGVLHTWGRQLQYHPHIHYIVPGGGLSRDRTTWCPSSANFFVPVKALSPIYRAFFKDAMHHAGLLEQIDPQVWTSPWNVHSQAKHHGHSAFAYLAPYVFKVAISNHRLVASRTAR